MADILKVDFDGNEREVALARLKAGVIGLLVNSIFCPWFQSGECPDPAVIVCTVQYRWYSMLQAVDLTPNYTRFPSHMPAYCQQFLYGLLHRSPSYSRSDALHVHSQEDLLAVSLWPKPARASLGLHYCSCSWLAKSQA